MEKKKIYRVFLFSCNLVSAGLTQKFVTCHQILWRGQEKIIADVVPSEEFDKNAGIRSAEPV